MSLHPDFINELKKHFTGDIRHDTTSIILYSTDASIYQIEPLGVAIPKTQDDLQAAVELAAKYKVPILPRGAGSSLGGQAIGHALILDCSRWLDSIIEIDPDSRTAAVEPGVVLSTLNSASAQFGLTFGPDPASAERATMGGVIGNNATGAHSILYGMSADHVISADIILGDGTRETWDAQLNTKLLPVIQNIQENYAKAIRQNYPKTWRNSAGYRLNYLLPWSPSIPSQWDENDYGLTSSVYRSSSAVNLASLLAGSEGTLAVMRRATVNLVPKPKHATLGVLAYRSIADACDDIPRLLELKPSAIELIPRMILQLARSVPSYARQMGWIVGDPAAVLAVEFSGSQPSALKDAVRRLGDVLTIAESTEEQARVWNIRKMGLGILDSRPQAARPAAFIEDCAIPVERLGEFVREVERIMSAHGTEGGIYAHVSAGCLHIRPVLDLQKGEGVRALRSIGEQVFALTMRLGGSMSSEHGDGIVAGEWIEKTYGNEVTDAMRMLKRAADPDNLLNPNKLFDAPPMDTHLRFGESYRVQSWNSSLHFDHERGLVGAIEHCNGQGVCRKTNGVMCPSYQATREEQNSTRGRANLLRALIARSSMADGRSWSVVDGTRSGELMEATYQALELCLACKGCKSECPSGVDMAKLKYEFENEYYKIHRRPLRDYVFGYFHITAALASAVAPLSNAVMSVPLFKNVTAKVLGITEERPFPKFSRSSFKRDLRGGGEKIIFLSDPFARYIEPQVEQAAFDVFSACGYDVRVLPIIGAGASLLSKGFIEAAKRHAGKVLDVLEQIDPKREAVIVGVEPPEIYCLKNDYVDLLPDRADEIASRVTRTWLLDEYLLRSEGFSKLRVGKKAKKKSLGTKSIKVETEIASDKDHSRNDKIKFQPHCHQRAQGLAHDDLPGGTYATAELLHLCGYEVDVLDAGCCGMAGIFGYEVEHYDLSQKVGELRLFPLLRTLFHLSLRDTFSQYDIKSIENNKSSPDVFGRRQVGVVATGAACRMQIHQGTGVETVHPIMLVRDFLFRMDS
ncbi:MAG TPA: FAD-linked oxidase C-terminal domain-containing protein [Anaerolineales bacterium]